MRIRALLVAAVLTAMTLSGCGGDDAEEPEPTPDAAAESSGPEVLSSGKSLLELEAGTEYASPEGFAPALRLTVPGDGWVSTHRGADGFDIGLPVPDVDAALLVVAFLAAPEASSDEALQAITGRAEEAGATVTGSGPTIHVNEGDGPLVVSRDGGIALDATPDGYSTIEATDTDGGTLLKVTWVPDAANQTEADQQAAALLALVTQD